MLLSVVAGTNLSGSVVQQGAEVTAHAPSRDRDATVSVVEPNDLKQVVLECRAHGAEVDSNISAEALSQAIEQRRALIVLARDHNQQPCGLLILGRIPTATLVMGYWERGDIDAQSTLALWDKTQSWLHDQDNPPVIHASSLNECADQHMVRCAQLVERPDLSVFKGAPSPSAERLVKNYDDIVVRQLNQQDLANIPSAEALGVSSHEQALLRQSLEKKRGLLLIAEHRGQILGTLIGGSLFGVGCVSHLNVAHGGFSAVVSESLLREASAWFRRRKDTKIVAVLRPGLVPDAVAQSLGLELATAERVTMSQSY